MARAILLFLAVVSELGVAILYAIDPDHFDVAQLVDFANIHHETLELLLAVLGAIFFIAYWRSGSRSDRTGGENRGT